MNVSIRRLRHLIPLTAIFVLLVGMVPPAQADSFVASKIEPSLLAAIQSKPNKSYEVIVQAEPAAPKKATGNKKADADARQNARKDRLGKVAKLIREKDENETGKLRDTLGLVNGFTAELKGKRILKLSKQNEIRSISGNHIVDLAQVADTSTAGISTTDTITSTELNNLKSMETIVAGAQNVWLSQGVQGQGVTVAVLDSNVKPSADLLNLSFGVSTADSVTSLADLGGHGTHVAGIVAGAGNMLPNYPGKWRGIAPGARILSVKVTTDSGVATYGSIIKGLQWIVANRQAQNIRVANLSLGAPVVVSYKEDPLAAAVELAWFSGIVVVASAGNKGSYQQTITVPGNDPYVITVGAEDDKNTSGLTDDIIPTWSSRGPTKIDLLPKPDVVAGGHRVVSLRAVGSLLDLLLPDRRVDTHYFRLSGTSMAAPVVAGVAALVLSANPALTPNQVKHIIKSTAVPYASKSVHAQGSGQVRAVNAVNAAIAGGTIPSANQNVRPSNIFARSIYTLAQGAPVSWRHATTADGRNWNNWTWENGTWDNGTWDNLVWENIDWLALNWTNGTWESLTGWSNGTWDNGTWDNGTWDNGTWDNGTWDSGTWDNGTWDNGQWDSDIVADDENQVGE